MSRSTLAPGNGWRSGWLLALLVLAAATALLWAIGRSGPSAAARPDPRSDPAGHVAAERRAEVKRRFDEAVVMLHAKRFEHAATSLHRVLELEPSMPEAHVNMGFAMLGLGRTKAARDFFEGATTLKPDQANAYYGLALTFEADGDLRMALGAMRSYLHLARGEDEAHLRRARAALWEWEARLQETPATR